MRAASSSRRVRSSSWRSDHRAQRRRSRREGALDRDGYGYSSHDEDATSGPRETAGRLGAHRVGAGVLAGRFAAALGGPPRGERSRVDLRPRRPRRSRARRDRVLMLGISVAAARSRASFVAAAASPSCSLWRNHPRFGLDGPMRRVRAALRSVRRAIRVVPDAQEAGDPVREAWRPPDEQAEKPSRSTVRNPCLRRRTMAIPAVRRNGHRVEPGVQRARSCFNLMGSFRRRRATEIGSGAGLASRLRVGGFRRRATRGAPPPRAPAPPPRRAAA